MARELKVSKEDFARLNEEKRRMNEERNAQYPVYSDMEIDLFFGDDSVETIQAALKLKMVFQYKDRLYNAQNLSRLNASELKKMAGDDLFEYLELIEDVAEYQKLTTILEYVDKVREKIG